MVRKTAKHVARNKKKYWRKISTQDIEDQLEDVRVQEMTGYVLITGFISTKFYFSVVDELINLIMSYIRSIMNVRLVRNLQPETISNHRHLFFVRFLKNVKNSI